MFIPDFDLEEARSIMRVTPQYGNEKQYTERFLAVLWLVQYMDPIAWAKLTEERA